MPRRPLLLTSVALILVVGIFTDLGWRAYAHPGFFVSNDGTLVALPRRATDTMVAAREIAAMAVRDSTQASAEMVSTRTTDSRLPIASSSGGGQESATAQPVLQQAIAITVNGQDVTAVATDQDAQAVRDRILDEYKSTILKDAQAIEQLKFQETISWRPKMVNPENIRSVEEATNILKLGTDKLVTYVVQSGDTGWDIARSYNVSPEQLAKANPNADIERLQIGQKLNVTFKEPHVHTQSVSKRVVKEGIPFTEQIVKDNTLWPWQYQVMTPGAYGTRELTLREIREGGKVVKTEVVTNTVLAEPKPQVAKQGTKQIPDLGTGTLVYPVVGVLTSTFGPRWGSFHNGIDIGANIGTPILAADSGMVVFRGWSGNYGYLLQVDHGGGKMETWYGHLSRFAVNLGDTVEKGQVIGYVGNTGFSTGPHLHYEVHVNGTAVNPLQFYQ